MLLRKFQLLAQWIGFLTIAGFALYGVVTLGSGRAWAVGNAAPSAITIPSTFNYQGFLRDAQGNAITGTRKIKVSLWTAVTAGSERYTETFTDVSVRDGLFNVVMGSTESMDPGIFQNNVPLFVGVTVDDGAELIPRQRIHPVPWALLSTSAQSANTANTASTLNTGATVQNLIHIGPLSFEDTKHKIDTISDQFTNGAVLRFFGPKGFSWVHADDNAYIMHLNKTVGLSVSGKVGASGDISTNGTFRAAGAGVVVGLESDLMIVRGWGTANTTVGVTNPAFYGAGYTYKKISQGVVDVTFNSPFASVPSVTATALSGGAIFTHITGLGGAGFGPSTSGFRIIMYDTSGNGRDWPFNFIAIGARPGSSRAAEADTGTGDFFRGNPDSVLNSEMNDSQEEGQ